MGIDVNLHWTGKKEFDITKEIIKEAQRLGRKLSMEDIRPLLKNMSQTGKEGYLRGSYMGGFADVIEYLFGWWEDWSIKPIPFSPKYQKEFEIRLNELSVAGIRSPSKHGEFFKDTIPKAFNITVINLKKKESISKSDLQDYRDFLNLAKSKSKAGKKVWVTISF